MRWAHRYTNSKSMGWYQIVRMGDTTFFKITPSIYKNWDLYVPNRKLNAGLIQ